jgi:hypothetical protein
MDSGDTRAGRSSDGAGTGDSGGSAGRLVFLSGCCGLINGRIVRQLCGDSDSLSKAPPVIPVALESFVAELERERLQLS